MHTGENTALPIRKIILANHNSAEYKKLLTQSDFRGARCIAWQEPTKLMQQKAPISILIYDKEKCRVRSRKQNKEGLIYAADQNSQKALSRFKHKPNNGTAAACIAEAIERALRHRSVIGKGNLIYVILGPRLVPWQAKR